MADKKFLTYEEQINLLKSRNLDIQRKSTCIEILKNDNYYSVINGYKEPFIAVNATATTDEKYKSGANINELYALYKFDCELRSIILKRLLRIEHTIKAVIAYNFSERYGYSEQMYLKQNNFDLVPGNFKRAQEINALINIINKNIKEQKDKNRAIKHYKQKYGYIPLWVLMNILTIGNISHFYSLMKQGDRQTIAKEFNVLDSHLTIILGILSNTRNICAHDEKFYDFKSTLSLPNNKYHQFLSIPKDIHGYKYGKTDFFCIIIILKLFLSKSEFKKVIQEIEKNLNSLSRKLHSINVSLIIDKMHLPVNWKDILKA